MRAKKVANNTTLSLGLNVNPELQPPGDEQHVVVKPQPKILHPLSMHDADVEHARMVYSPPG
jgi:hypothetical protein